MNKKDFKKIFKNGLGIEKFYYKQALRGKSEIRCFECGSQCGIGYVYKKVNGKRKRYWRVKCINHKSHNETLIGYSVKYVNMVNGAFVCKTEHTC